MFTLPWPAAPRRSTPGAARTCGPIYASHPPLLAIGGERGLGWPSAASAPEEEGIWPKQRQHYSEAVRRVQQQGLRRSRGDRNGALRGVVAEGAVGSRWTRSLRVLRYEIRRWRDGVIPDIAEAVDSPQRLTDDPLLAQRLLDLVPDVPTPVWGRDELQAGEMWNSNSLISWLIARSGLDVEAVHPPLEGRAPGWHAGLVVARATRLHQTHCRSTRSDRRWRPSRSPSLPPRARPGRTV